MTRLKTRLGRIAFVATLTLSMATLAACDSAEERAEKHYQSGLALLEEGDFDRAMVEFRNVFELDQKHKDARLTVARMQLERGNIQSAYGNYLKLVEQYPDDIEGRIALSKLAFKVRNWQELERHVTRASEMVPEDMAVRSLRNTLTYFNANRDRDETAREAAVVEARELVLADASLQDARMIVIDDLLRKQDWPAALDEIDLALKADPDDLQLYLQRLGVLQQMGDIPALEAQLVALIDQFPENEDFKQNLIRLLIAQGKTDDAEAFLRSQVNAADSTIADNALLISFLERFKGRDVALEELNTMIADAGARDLADMQRLRGMRAVTNFSIGDRAGAIAELESVTEGAERTELVRDIEIDLAKMLFAEGNSVGARALVETVLTEDNTHPGAVKLKAGWLVNDDETADAILLLRDGLSSHPEDAQMMTLLAGAYEREGNRDLMVEMLSLAVEAANQAPDDSLRYANVLIQDNKLLEAESVLIDALRLQPQNLQLLYRLGQVYLQLEDWGRTDGIVAALEKLNDQRADAAAKELTVRKLAGQERSEELTALLESFANDPAIAKPAELALVRTYLTQDGPQKALDHLDTLIADSPEDETLQNVRAGLLAALNRADESEAIYRTLLETDPRRSQIWLSLYRLKRSQGETDAATAVLTEALAALPEDLNLLWAQAGELEAAGDIDGAIAIYEGMYERNSGAPVIANNLASLLATYRDDDASLERAYTISRRLRGTQVAPFQDTYGWIATRRGRAEEGLPYLESAAAALSTDPTVQYHLGVALAALGRSDEALAQLEKVTEILAAGKPNPDLAQKVADQIAQIEGTPKSE